MCGNTGDERRAPVRPSRNAFGRFYNGRARPSPLAVGLPKSSSRRSPLPVRGIAQGKVRDDDALGGDRDPAPRVSPDIPKRSREALLWVVNHYFLLWSTQGYVTTYTTPLKAPAVNQ